MFNRRNLLGSLVALLPIPFFGMTKEEPAKQLALPDGTKIFFLERDEFRIEYRGGKKEWANSKGYHRVDGPAIIWPNGNEEWYLNGQKHRTGGPAVTVVDTKASTSLRVLGNKKWYRHGKYHREDGPALEYGNGCEYWYYEGELHRIGGPAHTSSDGVKSWFENGIFIKYEGGMA